MTFDNIFYKDFLTKQFLDPDTEEDCETDRTAYVLVGNASVKDFVTDGVTAHNELDSLQFDVYKLVKLYESCTCFGKWPTTGYGKECILASLAKVIKRCCIIAAKLGCHDLTSYVRNAVVRRD